LSPKEKGDSAVRESGEGKKKKGGMNSSERLLTNRSLHPSEVLLSGDLKIGPGRVIQNKKRKNLRGELSALSILEKTKQGSGGNVREGVGGGQYSRFELTKRKGVGRLSLSKLLKNWPV